MLESVQFNIVIVDSYAELKVFAEFIVKGKVGES